MDIEFENATILIALILGALGGVGIYIWGSFQAFAGMIVGAVLTALLILVIAPSLERWQNVKIHKRKQNTRRI